MDASHLRQQQDTQQFFARAKSLGIPITDAQFEQIVQFYDLLIAKNAVMNLTRITEWPDFLQRHILESLLYSQFIEHGARVMDLGSGGGFPLIPLSIYRPDIRLTSVESVKKKALYLQETVATLGLKNIKVIADRAETLGHKDHMRKNFDVVTSRAVANLSTLSELCLPFLTEGGVMLALKGSKWEDEMCAAENAIDTLGGEFQDVYSPDVEDMAETNFLVQIMKAHTTPKMYPRLPGVPAKEPLK